MKKMLLLSALVIPGSVFASEVSDGSDISCYEEEYQAIQSYETIPAPAPAPVIRQTREVVAATYFPKKERETTADPYFPPENNKVVAAPYSRPKNEKIATASYSKPKNEKVVATSYLPPKNKDGNVFIAVPKKPEQTKVVATKSVEVRAVTPRDTSAAKFLKIEEILEAGKGNIVPAAKHSKAADGGLDKEFVQVKAYPASAYIPAVIKEPVSIPKDEILASWANDCMANARPNADCKVACCTPRDRVPMLRREAEWFKSFVVPTIEDVKESKKNDADKAEATLEAKQTTPESPVPSKTDPEEPALEQIATPASAPVEKVVVLPEDAKVDASKAKPSAKKKVSLKKKTSWKKSSQKAKKSAKTDKKPKMSEAELTALVNDAIAKMIVSPEIDTRLSGIAALAKYAPTSPASLKERVEQALIVFLDGRASIEPCPRFGDDPKTDIEKALALLTKIHNADKPVDLSNMNFSGIKITGLSFKGFDLSDSAFVGANIIGADFSGAKLSGSDFSKANIKDTNFASAEVDLSYFVETKIVNSNFSSAKINCSQLRDSIISGSKFKDAVMTSVLFSGSKVKDSSFVGADLTKADMNSMTLSKDNFAKANLYGANLMKSTIEQSNFAGADFTKLYLKHADLGNSKGIDINMIFAAVTDAKTKVPADIALPFANSFVQDSERFDCPISSCPVRLKGLENSYDYILGASFKVLDEQQSVGKNNWALCNINCIINADASYGDESLKKIASFVREKAPWPPVSNQQAATTIPAVDVQAALYIIGNRPESLEGKTVNLTKSDLRGADFYGYDMTGVDFTGSNLKGSLTGESQGLPNNTEYTVFTK